MRENTARVIYRYIMKARQGSPVSNISSFAVHPGAILALTQETGVYPLVNGVMIPVSEDRFCDLERISNLEEMLLEFRMRFRL